MNNAHSHISVRVAIPGVVDSFSKKLMVQGIIESRRKYRVESHKDLMFDI